MILERRDFLRLLGAGAGAAALGSCGRAVVPDRLVELALRGPGIETSLNTVCRLCEGGCGLSVRLVDALPVGLKGNPRHPLNRGGLCPVGQAGLEVLYAPERLQTPMKRDSDGGYVPTSWDEALAEITSHLTRLVSTGEGHRIAFLNGEPGGLFRELARRFTQALGSVRFVEAGEGAALPYRLSQGVDRVPGFDLAGSDLVLTVGLDLFEGGSAPLHAISALVGSRPTADRAGTIHVGTRLSPSAAKALEHLAVRPGTHAAAVLGIAHVLVREGRYDRRFVAERTFGFEDWTDEEGNRRLGFRRLLLERYYPDRAAALSGCGANQIIRAARRLARADSPLAVCGGEAVRGTNATWTALAAHSLNALLGVFDRPGGIRLPSPIPFTPLEPLPAPDTVSSSPAGDGRSALGGDPIEDLARAEDLDVVFVAGTNPVYDSPAGDALRSRLEKVPLTVAFAPFLDETAQAADLVLPPSLFLEAWQESTTPDGVAASVLSISQPVTEPFFDTRSTGDVLLQLARSAGGAVAAALPWESYESYLEQRLEGLLASGQGSVITGAFEESWIHFLEERGWRFLEHGDRKAFRRKLTAEGGWWNPVVPAQDWERLFSTETGRYEFFSLELERRLLQLAESSSEPSGSRAEALARGVELLGLSCGADEACMPHFEAPKKPDEAEHAKSHELTLVPFLPITGRGALAVTSPMVLEMYGYPVLSGWETWAELAPETAHQLGLEEGDRVSIESERGSLEASIKIEPGATPGCVHVPLGLGHSGRFGAGRGIGTNPLQLVTEARDPLSGALATTATAVEVKPLGRRRPGGPRPLEGGHA